MKFLKILLLVACIGSITIACGGGGGGASGGNVNAGLSYTGITSQVAVTQNNSQELTVGAFQQGQAGATIGTGAGVIGISSANNIHPRSIMVSQTLKNAIKEIDITSHSSGVNAGVVFTDIGSVFGDCGGRGDYYINVDDVTGAFNGSMNFVSYCSMGVVLSGSTTFAGVINLYTLAINSLNFSFNALSSAYMGDSTTMQGSVASSFTASTASINMTALIRDNNSGLTYKVDNLRLTITYSGGYFDAALTGLYYDPQYGYVVISTPLPVRFYYTDIWPSQGEILLTGISGTKARLTVTSTTQFMVSADTDGDGLYDYNTGNISWISL